MTIWKYKLSVAALQTIPLSVGAKILSVQAQGGDLYLWAEVDPYALNQESRTIEVFGTGHPMDDAKRQHISTTQMDDGALVWHIYERL